MMSGTLKNLLPLLLLAAAATAFFGAAQVLTTAYYHPSVTIRAPAGLDIGFLFTGRRSVAACTAATANVASSILTVCPGCRVTARSCVEDLSPHQQAILSNKPLDLHSLRLPDGGVVTYSAPDAAFSLATCQESARQMGGAATCYAPGADRPLPLLHAELLAVHKDPLGWLLIMLGAAALGAALYLLNLRDDLRARLRNLPRRAKRLIMIGVDLALVAAAFAATMVLRYGTAWPDREVLAVTLLLALLVALPVFMGLGMYRDVVRYMQSRAVLTVLNSVSVAALMLFAVAGLLELGRFEARDAFLYWLFALLFVGGSRIAAREYLRRSPAPQAGADRVIIYGAGDAGAQLAASLRDNKSLAPVAFVDDNADLDGSSILGIRVHAPQHLPSLIRGLNVRQVLLAMPSASKRRTKEIFDELERLRVRIRTIPRLSELIAGRASISDIADVGIEDLVGRDPVPPMRDLLTRCITGKTVLVTGAGGSIGSELCRQILPLAPAKLIAVDHSEYALYAISEELQRLKERHAVAAGLAPVLASVTPRDLMRELLAREPVHTIFHAAAYKHVPLLEANALEGIRNNVIGTLRLAEAALATDVETFVLVSTDKAVRPTNVMGASKRLAELIMQAMAGTARSTRFCMVRFGNVLDSSGSVIPVFRRQIQNGGPVTVTHPEITRYFMTIPEAAQLVIQAAAMAKGGDVFLLDMGAPVKILELAQRMIQLSGRTVKDAGHPDGDIEIAFTGLRPGEKLYEELLIGENASGTEHPLIMRAVEELIPWTELRPMLDRLEEACNRLDTRKARQTLESAVPIVRAESVPSAGGRIPPLAVVR